MAKIVYNNKSARLLALVILYLGGFYYARNKNFVNSTKLRGINLWPLGRKISKKDKPYARFYTKNLDRIDIFIWTDYAEIIKNSANTLEILFEKTSAQLSPNEVEILLELNNLKDEFFEDSYLEDYSSRIKEHVNYIVKMYRRGYISNLTKVENVATYKDFSQKCLSIPILNDSFVIDLEYENLLAKTSTVKYGYRVANDNELMRLDGPYLKYLESVLSEIAATIQYSPKTFLN